MVKDTKKIKFEDILSDWVWLVEEQKSVLLVTVFGDIFFIRPNDEINLLNTGIGELNQIASSVEEFEKLLSEGDNFDTWFLTDLYLQLQEKGVTLKNNEVYSFKTMPVLGESYALKNIEPTDMSVHFAMTGQMSEQIKDIPDGEKIGDIEVKE